MSATDSLEHLLSDIAETLDVPPSAYEQAEERYQAVGDWLCEGDSPVHDKEPDVYPQGSFALGTVVRPLFGDDYDLDAVVQLAGSKTLWRPAELKRAVGDRLKENGTYRKMLEPEGRRCWTLKYASEEGRHGFHLDLLPSILAGVEAQQEGASDTSLAITNRISPARVEWKDSDPKGYAEWFGERCMVRSARIAARTGVVAGVEPVKDFTNRAPLQRAVQLLKRYRDVLFRNDEHAPISVIITTLSAQAYEGEESLVDTLFGVVNRMSNFIEIEGDTVRIPNPVRPTENFADRWQGNIRKARAFLRWLEAAKRLEAELLAEPPHRLSNTLTGLLGENSGRAVMKKVAARHAAGMVGGTSASPLSASPAGTGSPAGLRGALSALIGLLRNATHRQSPPWRIALDGTSVKVRGYVTSGRGARLGEFFPQQPILPHAQLRYDADIRGGPYTEIYWQVTNTGAEAERANQLRGRFEKGGTSKVESSRYRGDHSIECFVVRDKVCIARSGPFVVCVRG